jgi:DNA-binding MarR family transcriptional regulator
MSSDEPRQWPPQTGAMLRIAWEMLMAEVMPALAAAGFDDLRPVHRPIVRNILNEARPTELAASLGLSKQAVNDILREFEAKGYITLEPDPDDGRAKRIKVTERGQALANAAVDLSYKVGHRWAEQVGKDRYAVFEAVLREITANDR